MSANAILVFGTAARSDPRARAPAALLAPNGTAIPVARALEAASNLGRSDGVLTAEHVRVIRDAVRRYLEIVGRGVDGLLLAAEGTDLTAPFAEIQRSAREEVEIVLGSRFRDPIVVQRLATEIIRACR